MKDTIKCEFTIEESNLIIKSLNLLRNYLSKQERTTETVDEIIIKITEYGKIEIDKYEIGIIINALNNYRYKLKSMNESRSEVNELLLRLIDDSDVLSEKKDPKCISTTTTLLYDYDDIAEINKELKTISEKISNELKEKSVYTSRVAVIIKDKYFKTTSHQNKLPNPTNSLNEIYEMSKKIFKEYWDETPVRLIGIRVDAFSSSKDYQISLFEDVKKKENDEIVDALIDSLIKKYGDKIIKK